MNEISRLNEDYEGYEGFAIDFYYPRTSIEHVIYDLKTCFSIDGFSFYQDNCHWTIYDEHTRWETNVILPEQHYGSLKVTLESRPFVYRFSMRDRIKHRDLFLRLWHKISCRKKGFWLRNGGNRVPMPRPKRTRPK